MRFRSVLFGAALMSLLALTAPCGGPSAPVPVASAPWLRITFENCGKPYPCELIENLSDAPVQLTVKNSYQEKYVTVPANGQLEIELDATDNR